MMEHSEIYFDNSATTCCTKQVADLVMACMLEDYGNPSSRHMKGVESEKRVKTAREQIAAALHASEKEIYFTSGGTESDNWAIWGSVTAQHRRGNHLITTSVEHPAILEPMKELERQGYRVTYLPTDEYGRIRIDDLEKALDDETIFVSIMSVNNELGTIQPVEECAKLVKAFDERILFHTDAVQAFGKIPMNTRTGKVDMISVSGHKIHAPKGTGFLYIRDGVRINPFMRGGGQQKGMRSGTDNVPGLAGLGQAAMDICRDIEKQGAYLASLRDRLRDGLNSMEDVRINTPAEGAAPHILNASFAGVRSEVLLHALEDKGIYISAGSACLSNKKQAVSHVLKAVGMNARNAESAVRFSFGTMNTPGEVDICLKALNELVPMLRRYTRH